MGGGVMRTSRRSAAAEIRIRAMEDADRDTVAELICVSTNYWYQTHGMAPIFPGGPADADVFYQVYSALEGSTGLVATAAAPAPSCSPRWTHRAAVCCTTWW